MDIRQENPPAKPAVAALKPTTAQLYKKFQRKLRKPKQAKKGQTSGEASGATPGTQEEKAPDPTSPESAPVKTQRGEREAVHTTQPTASVAAEVHSQGNPEPPKLIPLDILNRALQSVKPGEDLTAVIAALMAESRETQPENTPQFPTTQTIPTTSTKFTTPSPSPDKKADETEMTTTLPTPSTNILDPEPVSFYIPKGASGASEEKGKSVEPTGASEEKGESGEPMGASGEKEKGSEEPARVDKTGEVETGTIENLGVVNEPAENKREEAGTEKKKEGEALEQMDVEGGKEAETGGVEAGQEPARVSLLRPQGQPEVVVVVDDLVSSPERAPPRTRRSRVSRRLYAVETDKEKSTQTESEQPRQGPRIKRAHTSEEIAQFDKSPAASESAEVEKEDEVRDAAKESDEAEQSRKRKGKQIAEEPSKKAKVSGPMTRRRQAVEIQEPIKVPFAPGKEGEEKEESSEGSESSDESEMEEVPIYHQALVDVDGNLLKQMSEFPTEKLRDAHEHRSADTQQMKSGRKYHPAALQELGLEDKVRQYIEAIGFEWLLNHEEERVPEVLALEFFTTFRFKATTDLKKTSITFRIFNQEWEMSLREWSVRMGLYSEEESVRGMWKDRNIGNPGLNREFDARKAWRMLTHEGAGEFKASQSKGGHISDPALRFAQVFLGYNLLGQTSPATITHPELYLAWCMKKKIKVHLGYWLAYGINQVATHPKRFLTTCHLLGVFVHRNLLVEYKEGATCLPLCPPPTLFDLRLFMNSYLVKRVGTELRLYEVGVVGTGAVKTEEEEVAAAPADWKQTMQTTLMSLVQAVKHQEEALITQTQQLAQVLDLLHHVKRTAPATSTEDDPAATDAGKDTAGMDGNPGTSA